MFSDRLQHRVGYVADARLNREKLGRDASHSQFVGEEFGHVPADARGDFIRFLEGMRFVVFIVENNRLDSGRVHVDGR